MEREQGQGQEREQEQGLMEQLQKQTAFPYRPYSYPPDLTDYQVVLTL
jgi:hypothetical protein